MILEYRKGVIIIIENFEKVGERISIQMDKLNLKQVDLCRYTNISKNAISNYVKGNRIPDTLSAYKLSKALKVSMEWLLTGIEEHIPTNENPEGIEDLSSTESELLHRFRELKDRDKKEVLAYIKMKKDLDFKNSPPPLSTFNNGENGTGEESAASETA